jgi:hypothetical protein
MTAQKYLGNNPRQAKAAMFFLRDTECCTGRQQNGRQLPFRSPGGNDPRQKITSRPGWRNCNIFAEHHFDNINSFP